MKNSEISKVLRDNNFQESILGKLGKIHGTENYDHFNAKVKEGTTSRETGNGTTFYKPSTTGHVQSANESKYTDILNTFTDKVLKQKDIGMQFKFIEWLSTRKTGLSNYEARQIDLIIRGIDVRDVDSWLRTKSGKEAIANLRMTSYYYDTCEMGDLAIRNAIVNGNPNGYYVDKFKNGRHIEDVLKAQQETYDRCVDVKLVSFGSHESTGIVAHRYQNQKRLNSEHGADHENILRNKLTYKEDNDTMDELILESYHKRIISKAKESMFKDVLKMAETQYKVTNENIFDPPGAEPRRDYTYYDLRNEKIFNRIMSW